MVCSFRSIGAGILKPVQRYEFAFAGIAQSCAREQLTRIRLEAASDIPGDLDV
jgi:hypothetical protein